MNKKIGIFYKITPYRNAFGIINESVSSFYMLTQNYKPFGQKAKIKQLIYAHLLQDLLYLGTRIIYLVKKTNIKPFKSQYNYELSAI